MRAGRWRVGKLSRQTCSKKVDKPAKLANHTKTKTKQQQKKRKKFLIKRKFYALQEID